MVPKPAWLIAFGAAGLFAQPQMYLFGVDQDAVSGAPDFSFLNRPITPGDRLFVRDGHFYRVGADLAPNTADDERVRLYGVNLAFSANFPIDADATRVARRLRRLGVNLVRLHHMDTQPDSNPDNGASLLTTGPYPTLNPLSVRRLRAFLDSLKAEGIYINLNLHVGYQFRPAVDGVPELPGMAFPTQSKPLHVLYPRMVELQAEFTRQALSALELRDDPVLAMVEINNESSVVDSWQRGNLDPFLVAEYRTALVRDWNSHLAARYGTTAALREAWSGGEPDGPDILPQRWELEIHAPSRATMEPGPEMVMVRVSQGGAAVIAKQTGFSVSTDRAYTAEVAMRADLAGGQSRTVYWDIKQNVSPWRTVTGRNVTVTNQWQTFRMSLQPGFAMDNIGRFGLSVERVDVPLFIRNWKLHPAGKRGLAEEESIESANVALVSQDENATDARANDYLRFLAARDRAYLAAMLEAVRGSVDFPVPVAGTQVGFGGLLNLDSHDILDYHDNHFYVDHYNFPNTAWDGRDWRLRDASSTGAAFPQFLNLAAAREAGRPYTASEYNQPWPNTYAAEIDPALAAFAAFQDWDSIMHFAYSHGRGWDDGVPNGFNINGDWSKWVSFGQAAWLFRSGAIETGREPVELPLSEAQRLRATRERRNGAVAAFLTALYGYDPRTALVHPVRIARREDAEPPEAASAAAASPYRADTGQMTYDADARVLSIHAPQAAGVIGFAGGGPVTAGAIDVELAPGARGFAAVLITSLDGAPLTESARMLLTNPGYTLRSHPGAAPARPQALIHYPGAADWWTLEPDLATKPSGNLNGGVRPTWMERVESFVTLRTSARTIVVYPLDAAGQRLEPLGGPDVAPVDGGFRLHLQADGQTLAPWYEITAER